MGDGSGFGGFLLLGLIVAVIPIGLVVLGILVFASGREPDPSGRRPYAVYLCTVSFTAMFIALFAGAALVATLVGLAIDPDDDEGAWAPFPMTTTAAQAGDPGEPLESNGLGEYESPPRGDEFTPAPAPPVQMDPYGHEGSEGFDGSGEPAYDDYSEFSEDRGDAAARDAVSAGIILMAAGAALAFHLRKLSELRSTPGYEGTPASRVEGAYLYATCFVAVVVLAGAAVTAAYAIFEIAAPGVASSLGAGSREDGVTPLVTSAALALAGYLIAWKHWIRATELREGKPAPASAMAPEGATEV